ncbi:MAG: NADH-quinone oxidoreductase subunit G [Gammaproteobacteria bacterium]|nr:NADH-quinone oxidoreductase subunit G [Gammaproteobacteria bacterium]
MSATVTEAPKVEDTVSIEVDGQALTARKGAMLIDVTDAAGIYIPRFCYHKKLSVAANCRMCLVEVERAPKPQPACATPVMDGMKVFTKSPKAIAGQQATMEFLLINHPLDCPICDQGGECELQDLALGYGTSVSQYTERKRVVRDKNIGPLVQTDMTRCIHCTRCVRFGEEIAGLRELGATGRGENMEIGTYVAQAVTSELSGNVIDLCPVGALTSKPYRYSARAWELRQHDTIAPHDCVGSALHVHVKGQVVKRVVPRENESANETWISDRDRFSYQGLNSPERLLAPRLRENGVWRECDWTEALSSLQRILQESGGSIGALASPSSTTEEFFLLQKLVRALGSHSIDHRLRQVDFSADANEPAAPGLGATLAELEQADAIVIAGGYPRHDQPLINHRIRKAANCGAAVVVLDTLEQEYNFELAARLTSTPANFNATLGAVVRACAEGNGQPAEDLSRYVITPGAAQVAGVLAGRQRVHLLAGTRLQSHADRALTLGLLSRLASLCKARLGVLTEGANAAGAWLAGAVPHRLPGAALAGGAGANAAAMAQPGLKTLLLLGCEPEADHADPAALRAALAAAREVVAFTAFTTEALESKATLLLPIAAFAENEGTFVNVQGDWQSFAAAVKPPGQVRPAWKILRRVGEQCGFSGFDAVELADVTAAVRAACAGAPASDSRYPMPAGAGGVNADAGDGLWRVTQVPLYRVDSLVRRAHALQQMPQAGDEKVHLHPETLAALGLADGARVRVSAGGEQAISEVQSDAAVPPGSCLVHAATVLAAQLPVTARISLRAEGSAS